MAHDYRREIDGLRGVAVGAVVAFHAGIAGFSWGFWGVDVFFVISGYLISGIILRELNGDRFVFVDFWARRVRRLVPAAGFTVLGTLAAVVVIGSPLEWLTASSDAIFASTWMLNASLGLREVHYFDANADVRPLLHFWSLAVEEQFYLVWPVLLVLGSRLLRCPRLVIVVVFVATLALSVFFSTSHPNMAFFLTPFRMWELALGAIAGFVVVPPHRRPLAGVAGLVVFVGGIVLLSPTTAIPGVLTLLPTTATALWLNIGMDWPGARLLASRPFVVVGGLSYSLYLYHWPVLVLLRPLAGPSAAATSALLTLALALAWLSRRFVEQPLRFHPALVSSTWRTLLVGVLVIGVSVGSALLVRWVTPLALRRPEIVRLQAVRKDAVSLDGCDGPAGCQLRDGAGPTVLVLGDSHAMQWTRAVVGAAEARDVRVVYAGRSACPGVPVATTRPSRRDPVFAACRAFHDRIPQILEAVAPSAVVVANFEGYVEEGAILAEDEDKAIDAVVDAHRSLFAALKARGIGRIYVADNPSAFEDPVRCIARGGRGCEVVLDDRRHSLRSAVRAAAAHAGAVIVDATALACPDGRCPIKLGGVDVWRDRHHLTGSFARGQAMHFERALEAALEY
jgi:peptidoglycan/LPS O-acetylase OafA/YrhL